MGHSQNDIQAVAVFVSPSLMKERLTLIQQVRTPMVIQSRMMATSQAGDILSPFQTALELRGAFYLNEPNVVFANLVFKDLFMNPGWDDPDEPSGPKPERQPSGSDVRTTFLDRGEVDPHPADYKSHNHPAHDTESEALSCGHIASFSNSV